MELAASLDTATGSTVAPSLVSPFDLASLTRYFERLLPPLLGVSGGSEVASLFASSAYNELAPRFGDDPSLPVVYVTKTRLFSADGTTLDAEGDLPRFRYTITTDMTYHASNAAMLAFIKRSPVLDTSRPLETQMHFVNFPGPAAYLAGSSPESLAAEPGSSPYEALHNLVHLAVAPYFDAFINSKGENRAPVDDKAKEADGKMGIPMTRKKFAELELSLLHLQQNVEIPEIQLVVHPIIQRAIDKCRMNGTRVSPDAIDASLQSDSTFLNKIQSEVNSWIKEIQTVTKLNRDVASGTASQEINFWISMERALEDIEEQLRSEPITLTLDVLRNQKRFHATVSFIADTGLREAADVVHKYNQLMKDFPLNELLAATGSPKIAEALNLIFGHINRKLRISPYPIRRALPLVEAISRDLNEQILKVLSAQRLMYMDYVVFERAMQAVSNVFYTWDECIKEFTNVAREVTRKRSEKFIPIKINPAHTLMVDRVSYLRQFRKQHEQMARMLHPTRGLATGKAGEATVFADFDMEEEVRAAYDLVKGVDVLDVSLDGTQIWRSAEDGYKERVSRVENQIITVLRDRLGAARNTRELLRVFSRFNALFVRPKVRSAVQDHQSQLLDSVKDDIRRLHEKFKQSYKHTEAYHMSQLRDLPPISGAIVWARQIDRQLSTYMKRVEDVLGKGWELYAEGQRLQSESLSFRRKLETRPVYEAWLHEIQRRDLQIAGLLFNIVRARMSDGLGQFQLTVNFDPQIITLFKEVRSLLWLGFSVQHQINNVAKDAKRVYPHAVSLMETVHTYSQTCKKVALNPGIAALVAEYHADVQSMISKGLAIRWEWFVSYMPSANALEHAREGRHGSFVREFASAVSAFQDRCDALVDMYLSIVKNIDELRKCPHTTQAFSSILDRIQSTVDRLNLEGYANLDTWVSQIDKQVEGVLLQRLRDVIAAWSHAMTADAETGSVTSVSTKARRPAGGLQLPNGLVEPQIVEKLSIDPLVHELRIRNQVIYLDPPIESARTKWYDQLQTWLAIICCLSRIRSSRYEVGLQIRTTSVDDMRYTSLLSSLEPSLLERCYKIIESKVRQISTYVEKWLQFQSLWDLEAETVYARLGDSLSDWQQLLNEIRATRATFDNADVQRSFGIAIIKYEQVQSKVNAKYDAWQRDILSRFGARLGSKMKETHAALAKARVELEQHSIEGSSTAQAVTFITFVQDLSRKVDAWGPQIALYGSGQVTLERQRFTFPGDWLYVDQIEGEWTAVNDILARKTATIQEQLSGLQVKIVAEDRIVRSRIDETLTAWESNKPIQGNLRAEDAINAVNAFESRVNKLKEDAELVAKAKQALALENQEDLRLVPVTEEIRDLKTVWTALSGTWSQINELREIFWTSIQPRKLRLQMEGLLQSTRDMPSRMRQYAAFEHVQEVLRGYTKSMQVVTDLKSEALRERHWRQLYKAVRVGFQYTPSSMTLGSVWDLDLRRNERAIKETIVQAQGEMALEEYLKQVKEAWTSYALDLVNYQNKTRLIRGWDDLFARCSEHVNSLVAMRHSPYYKVFAEDASNWEDRLNRIHLLFDVWIDVQRQWVYLEGIFSGSADIKHLLPVESSRFSNINQEFLVVMKKVVNAPFVLEIINIAGIQKSLERLAELLSKIQKALGEYLERERASFPRFYFVGDEDLLEILGNSKDVLRIQKHLKKMFAGIASMTLSPDLSQIEGISSREGEVVRFEKAILFKDLPKINDWLAKLEIEMKAALARHLETAHRRLVSIYESFSRLNAKELLEWIDETPAQIVILSMQVEWTRMVDLELSSGLLTSPSGIFGIVTKSLEILADAVLSDLTVLHRRKCEHVITELVHQRDVIRALVTNNARSPGDFAWLYQMRYYYKANLPDDRRRLIVCCADAEFNYAYEYLGAGDRLVQTPLTDRCYYTLTQALQYRLGGAPFGPAGTGKTESVKALGALMGRFVIVFCCDEQFDYHAMGRIFTGLCQVGATACFDEFNRLSTSIMSSVSQDIQSIQTGLSALANNPNAQIQLHGKTINLHADTGIFITSNPGYAGRSELPDNLKKLFRNISMTRPDRESIAQVMLFSQGFRSAEVLARKIVPFFNLCLEQLSSQPHYDFGLRALKAVLISAGQLKRSRIQTVLLNTSTIEGGPAVNNEVVEQQLLVQSVTETMVPKLISEDVPLLSSLLTDVFPGIQYTAGDLDQLRVHVTAICAERSLLDSSAWLAKVLQLYQIQEISHGVMMAGPSGTGKTNAWRVLSEAIQRWTGVESVSYVIDPKAINKEALYGTLDTTTREWTDGLFTHILRKIIDNVRGESAKRHWIVFDGDVDPEWVENLNSVLDDNKLLTLPNGERLALPPNVRIMFEVESLRYATLATVSRCGMVWFSEGTVSPAMIIHNHLSMLKTAPILASLDATEGMPNVNSSEATEQQMTVQQLVVSKLESFFVEDGLVLRSLEFAATLDHIMDFTRMRALSTLFLLINRTIRYILDYNAQHSDFPLGPDRVEAYVSKRLLGSIVWAFTGDSRLETRGQMGDFLHDNSAVELPPASAGSPLIDYDVRIDSGAWFAWQSLVPTIELEIRAITSSELVIPTIDTIRHEELLYAWLSEHKPLLLCGPPGSGKTMTLLAALRKLPDMEIASLNFSSATSPEFILKTFEQYCECRKTPNGMILSPTQIGRWLVVFCDEINLPAADKYGTQRVISFLRQLVEAGGYWHPHEQTWIRLERIQFVGACNPPTDPGRVALSHRFLRHAPLLMVDYPGETSLHQIYGSFNRTLLKTAPVLRGYADALTAAMIDFYLASQKRFTPDIQAHYVYSPRELTRWMRGIYETIRPLDSLTIEDLVRVWAHEALRLFSDRLVHQNEREWTDKRIDACAMQHFPTIEQQTALARPILFSNWTSQNYISVERETLREFTKARLRVFYEEELDVQLVLFNDVLDHVLRIDRVFRQIQGHVLLIGVSGSGKTTLSRFVAWMTGLNIFQLKVHSRYTAEDFDDDLRNVLRRAGCKGEKLCFIFDETNALEAGFLERMNTLLANAEVPGLFEGDEYAALMTACKEGAARDGVMLDSNDELYRWFTQQIARNLHVVFCMNPPEAGLGSRAATSPALFNRCVLDWLGDWSEQAFFQVGTELTETLDLGAADYVAPIEFPVAYKELALPPSHREAIINAFVHVHLSMYALNRRLSRRQGRVTLLTPRHYLEFLHQFVKLFQEKRDNLEEQQRHLNVGLHKLQSTVVQVEELRGSLAIKRQQLEAKDAEANEKLKRMVTDQQEAEQQKAASIRIKAALAQQDREISDRREVVVRDLAEAEPAVLNAQAAVSNIKKQHLTEVRSMANPPEAVKLAMESVCVVLGHRIDSWKTVQSIIRRDDFIASIVNYDTERQMGSALRNKLQREFLARPGYDFESVNRASKACGPLVMWVIAQVGFAEILDRVGPLREEVDELENQAQVTKQQAEAIVTMIDELETSIAQYKGEYAQLISETQTIKLEMEKVQARVERSILLLESLESEKERWEVGSTTFQTQMSTIAGDVLLSAAFLAYAGIYDQTNREDMLARWTRHLSAAGIASRTDLSLCEYLSTADERLQWQSHALPQDDLSIENAIMLKRYHRYPLVIDPSGQAIAFLVNNNKDRKTTVTSFLDPAFLKNLESAMRFGTTLLVNDADELDPIVYPILNREVRRAGGRVLVRLGGQDIDLSPSFACFLITRDSSFEFGPDIASRVTFVNFTMTRGSLQSQTLSKVLRVERPEVDQRRSDLLKLQGEFKVHLRHLERALLDALNESSGNILDDDSVIDTLERLKREAAEITRKASFTDSVMAEVEQMTSQYVSLSRASSALYFVISELHVLNHFYRFSLQFFLDIFDYVLSHNSRLSGVTDHRERLSILTGDLFLHTFKRTSQCLLKRDHPVLLVLLAQVYLRDQTRPAEDDAIFQSLLDPQARETTSKAPRTAAESAQLKHLGAMAPFKGLQDHISHNAAQWQAFLSSERPEDDVPIFRPDLDNVSRSLRSMLIIQSLRPDRLLQAATVFARSVFGYDVLTESSYDLKAIVQTEVKASTPVCLASVPGHDASYRIKALESATGTPCRYVALGSTEDVQQADKAITAAARNGTWVSLQNVHLAMDYLALLEKRLPTLQPASAFRLFLTMETNPSIPPSILRASRVVMNEPSPGVRAQLEEMLINIPPSKLEKGPAELPRLIFLLCWLAAIVGERSTRFAPVGFAKAYSFDDSDFGSAFDTISAWVNRASKGRANIDPAQLPWAAIQATCATYAFGGRIDVDMDQQVLSSFVGRLFTPKAYDVGFELVAGLPAPEGRSIDAFLDWTRSALPEVGEHPALLNLPKLSAAFVAAARGEALIESLRRMRSVDDDEVRAVLESVVSDSSDAQPSWMISLLRTAQGLLGTLPTVLTDTPLPGGARPLQRFFTRERHIAASLLATVRADLDLIIGVCQGAKQTNHARQLIADFSQGSVPRGWQRFKCKQNLGLNAWTADFEARLQHLERQNISPTNSVWLGGLFAPSSYISAARQEQAHALNVSLEQLQLILLVGDESVDRTGFDIEGMSIQCAGHQDGSLRLNDGETVSIRRAQLQFVDAASVTSVSSSFACPAYLNTDRKDLLFSVNLAISGAGPDDFVQRGVCLVAHA